MIRRDLVRHLEAQGCELLREGGRHSVFINREARRTSSLLRHKEINDYLASKICRDLGVRTPV